jgi:aryl-alcohol dehydrogenase-like predicted oxidoreductase
VRELGLSLVPYGVLARGLLSDNAHASAAAASEIRTRQPRFAKENLPRNLALVAALQAIAKAKGCTTAQLALAWVLSRGPDIVPLIGARRRDQLQEGLGALDVTLSESDVARIERAVPLGAAAGERYQPAVLAHMDSEHAA